jgi:hypothetical protein
MNKNTAFIEKAVKVHGYKYDYSRVNYRGNRVKVIIGCPENGWFEQTPANHLSGHGVTLKLNTEKFIALSRKVHGDKYDYSEVHYTSNKAKVTIKCPIHGKFEQEASSHMKGRGCAECGKINRRGKIRVDYKEFVKRAKDVHGNKYEYLKSDYKSITDLMTIKCPKHGIFIQRASDHTFNNTGCPRCSWVLSAAESEIRSVIDSIGIDYYHNDRTLIKPLELDIVIPSLKIAIEYNGLIWHSEKHGKDKWYHYNKSKMCANKGYRLIHIWEDDWNRNKQLQIEFLKYQLGVSRYTPIYARECTLATISKKQASEFLDLHHIQGSTVFSEAVCLAYKGEIVTVSCFTKRSDKYELVRHCSSKPVIGSLGKCVKHFHKIHNTEIYTFLDKSRYVGKSYEKAGFIKACEIPPDYMYVKGSVRYHKFNFRRAQIKRKLPDVYSEELSESQMMEKAGYTRVWDCGKTKYVFTR